MNLDEIMRKYEVEMDDWRQHPMRPLRFETQMHITQVDGTVTFDLAAPFSLMFWRLYPDGALASGLDFETPNIARASDAREFPDGHRHNYIELSYVYKGSFSQVINGKEQVFEEGDVWIMDRNCLHYERRFGYNCFVVFFEINEDFFDELFDQSFKGNPAGVFIKEALMEKRSENRFIHFTPNLPTPEVKRIFDYALEERELSRPGAEYVLRGLFISLFALLALNYSFHITEQKQRTLNQQLYNKIQQYMRDHYQNITLEHLARVFCFNRRYLGRLIQSAGGLSYKDLLQQIRLEQAADRLIHSTLPVSEIAAQVGYQNITHFYRLFKERYGMTPNQYRNRFGD